MSQLPAFVFIYIFILGAILLLWEQVTHIDVDGGGDDGQNHQGEADFEVVDEGDFYPAFGGHAGYNQVGGGADEGAVAAKAGA